MLKQQLTKLERWDVDWWAKCLLSFSQDCSLLSGSLTLEELLIGVHCEKRYKCIDTIQYKLYVLLRMNCIW